MKCKFLISAIVVVCCACSNNNPYDPENIPGDLGMAVTLSGISSDSVIYCFYPLGISIDFGSDWVRYVDSIKVLSSSDGFGDTSYNVNVKSRSCRISYSDTGEHVVRVRVFGHEGLGRLDDIVFNVKVKLGFSGEAVDMELADIGSYVQCKASGRRFDGVKWHWDMSGVSTKKSAFSTNRDDTTVFVDNEYTGAVYLSQIFDNRKTASVAVPFRTFFHKNSSVGFIISPPADVRGYNAECHSSITFAGVPRPEDKGHIDSMLLYIGINSEPPRKLTESNGYTTKFAYADTGRYSVWLRTYNTNKIANPVYMDTVAFVRIGERFGGCE